MRIDLIALLDHRRRLLASDELAAATIPGRQHSEAEHAHSLGANNANGRIVERALRGNVAVINWLGSEHAGIWSTSNADVNVLDDLHSIL